MSDREIGRVNTGAAPPPPRDAAAAVATTGRGMREFLIIAVARSGADKSCSKDAMAILPFVEIFVVVDVVVDFASWMLSSNSCNDYFVRRNKPTSESSTAVLSACCETCGTSCPKGRHRRRGGWKSRSKTGLCHGSLSNDWQDWRHSNRKHAVEKIA